MKSKITKTIISVLLCFTFFSFTNFPGGEGFEIFINNKVVLQQFGNDLNNAKTIRLNKGLAGDELTVKYHHCGQAGRNRVLTIKDGKNNILKEFRFPDTGTRVSGMKCSINDIISLKRRTHNVLKLFYSSSELPAGRLLATLETTDAISASLKP